jgi:transposase-like protein
MVRKSARQRRHTAAFKWEAVQLLQQRVAAGVSMQRVADELEVDLGLLRTWANAVAGAPAGTPAPEIFPGSGHPRAFRSRPAAAAAEPPPEAPEAELRRLRRENERLRQERDFLKKAAAFFAKESR